MKKRILAVLMACVMAVSVAVPMTAPVATSGSSCRENFTIDDALQILRHLVGLPSSPNPCHAFDGYPNFSIGDALQVLRYLVDLSTDFGGCPGTGPGCPVYENSTSDVTFTLASSSVTLNRANNLQQNISVRGNATGDITFTRAPNKPNWLVATQSGDNAIRISADAAPAGTTGTWVFGVIRNGVERSVRVNVDNRAISTQTLTAQNVTLTQLNNWGPLTNQIGGNATGPITVTDRGGAPIWLNIVQFGTNTLRIGLLSSAPATFPAAEYTITISRGIGAGATTTFRLAHDARGFIPPPCTGNPLSCLVPNCPLCGVPSCTGVRNTCTITNCMECPAPVPPILVNPNSDIGNPEMRTTTATDVVENIGAGWNLGNSFDARTHDFGWAPQPTQRLIQEVHAAGFDSIRIPVTWTMAGNWPANSRKATASNNWTISEEKFNDVEQVVTWAYELGMTVIINAHHEDAIQDSMLRDPDLSDYIHTRIWTQITERFNNQFGSRLIFGGTNEPRVRGITSGNVTSHPNNVTPDGRHGGLEWIGNAVNWEALNRQHQIFVDIVRASGGNNWYRSLLIVPHAASATSTSLGGLRVPGDPTPNRFILTAHTYSPVDFSWGRVASFDPNATRPTEIPSTLPPGALLPPYNGDYFRYRWYNHRTPQRILYYFDNIQAATERLNLPVVLGEWGSMVSTQHPTNNTHYRELHAEYYVGEATRRGWVTFWWDNNVVDGQGERFGLIDRGDPRPHINRPATYEWGFAGIVNAIMRGAGLPEILD